MTMKPAARRTARPSGSCRCKPGLNPMHLRMKLYKLHAIEGGFMFSLRGRPFCDDRHGLAQDGQQRQ